MVVRVVEELVVWYWEGEGIGGVVVALAVVEVLIEVIVAVIDLAIAPELVV